ncbi:MAG: hypothetical protein GEV04_20495 [Actinophytocola sp.]|nr:hypothetical protein [Actinophytocola sp.]
MRPRALAGAGATALGAVTAVAALVIGTAAGAASPSTAIEYVPSSAYGIAAEGPVPIDPTPHVESTDGSRQENSALTVPENPLVSLEVAKVVADESSASAELLNLALAPGAELPDQLSALNEPLQQLMSGLQPACEAENPAKPVTDALGEVLPSEIVEQLDPQQLCASITTAETPALVSIELVKVACDEKSGSVEIANVALLGQQVAIPPLENETPILPENPLVTITANKQTSNKDGSFTVVGLEIDLGGGTEVITLGSATCGFAETTTLPPPPPPPTPVTTGLPVTG